MTIYKQVSDDLGLNNDSQGELALLHALLMFADANPPGGADTFTNPYHEVVHRLKNPNPHALAAVKARLNDRADRFSRS